MTDSTLRRLTAVGLIGVPVLFMAAYLVLGMTFNYPAVLREPAGDVLRKFADGGSGLIAIWYVFAASTVLFIPLVILLNRALGEEGGTSTSLTLAAVFGVLAGAFQALGLVRWPFLVPTLSAMYLDPAATPESQAAALAIFSAFNHYAGVALGEHLGYLFTGLWTVLIATVMMRSARFWRWLPWLGIASGAGILIGLAEPVVGVAGLVNAAGYTAWAVWLVFCGVALLRNIVERPELPVAATGA